MEKSKIITAIVSRLEEELAAIELAAKASREAATHEESRAEDQHDTRGLEASYLAGAQAQRASELKQQISAFRMLSPKTFSAGEAIAPGALVELELSGKRSFYFLVGIAGGPSVRVDGAQILSLRRAPLWVMRYSEGARETGSKLRPKAV